MTILHDALTALLAGITQYKPNTKEIEWEDKYGYPCTIESLGDEKYVVRYYYANDNLLWEIPYRAGLREGVEKIYYTNDNLWREIPFKAGLKDGMERRYDKNGNITRQTLYKDDKIQ